MPRKPRAELEPGIWHVFARGNNRQALHHDDRDRSVYLRMLAAQIETRRWRCLGYCLMPNHVHLMVETIEPNLGAGIGRLHGSYAQWFNKRHRRSGHLFGERFGGVWIADDPQLWTVARYIAMNPVKARLCETPEEWRWSSYGAVVRGETPGFVDVERLLELFSGAGGDPRRRYEEFVGDALLT